MFIYQPCYSSQQEETTIYGWMDKQIIVYPYNGIYLAIKKEENTDTWYNMDETWENIMPK